MTKDIIGMASRTKNTARNIVASYVFIAIQIVFAFASKSIIVYTMGSAYLGLSSLFTSILNVLNVAELGFTTSIVYFMYKPLSDNDTDRVCALLSYLKRVYRIVGTGMIVVGLLLLPFLNKLIRGDVPSDINIYCLYFLYLINTAASYFLSAHKTALLTAVQRIDLVKVVHSAVIVLQYLAQIIALLLFRNYYLFVFAMIVGTFTTNIAAAFISKRYFPQYVCKGNLTKDDKNEILKKVKGLLICNISIVTYTTLDSVVISAFVGLVSVAIYSNYMTIYSALNKLLVQIRSAMQPSVGNSVASESVSKNLHDVFLWQFMFSIISTWCATGMLCLYQPFITIWMGEKMLLPMIDVILIVVWFSIDIVQQAQNLYLNAAGLWQELRYSYIFNTVCNLVLNILLGRLLGITGIIIASLVTCIISGLLWQCILIFKHYFKTSAKRYILMQLMYFLISTIIATCTYSVCQFVSQKGVVGLIIKACLCFSVSALLLCCFYIKSPYLNDVNSLIKKVLNKSKGA